MEFTWDTDGPPPQIEAHSKAKLEVLRRYLRSYLDRLNIHPIRDEFRIDLVDGFAGGGIFKDGRGIVSGTPLIMLEELKAAEERLNRNRRKPLKINSKCYFVDKDQAHVAHLRRTLRERGYDGMDSNALVVRSGKFEQEVDEILRSIKQRQPRAGRAIFLLDQTGYSQVELHLISRIFDELPAAEVILTFAVDALFNYLEENSSIVKALHPIGLSQREIDDLIQARGKIGGRALGQRILREQVRRITRATYDTPFFIKPKTSRRALLFFHLSRHPTARDVMIQQHWQLHNTFEHPGTGGFNMLGMDALKDLDSLSLFNFGENDREELINLLLNEFPRRLDSVVSEGPVTVDVIRHKFANETAARFSDMDEVLIQLHKEQEFDVLTPDGKLRSRSSLKQLRQTDMIALPSGILIPGIKR